ncbi:MAG: sodium:proton antiporter NhaD [Alphaproteobacteria bacterium]|nr:sodium:proton antiporter NhaD [Alphaproteobacteria bacterium]
MLDLTRSWVGYLCAGIFVLSYVLVIFEERLHLKKSKPVLLAAGLIWAIIGYYFSKIGQSAVASRVASEIIGEFGQLFLFLLVSIAYVNVLEERRMFDWLRNKLSGLGISYVQLYWLLGAFTFFLSSVLANMTTALVMGAVTLAVGKKTPAFVTLTCISIIVASNAGGAFSPFGDTTTLMVWQQGKLRFSEFFALFLPSLINWVIPAFLMQFAIPKGMTEPEREAVALKPGAWVISTLFAITVVVAVIFQNSFGLQPALGMMLGLGLLQAYAYALTFKGKRRNNSDMVLDSFSEIGRIEWDTMLFFFGVMFSVAGLSALGWLALANTTLYGGFGPTVANTALGIISAVLDNIPVMFAVLSMNPQMDHAQWLLITLTAGTGGSLLAIGSPAGVALMGLAPKHYTFMSHLKWSWAIALGYAAAIAAHLIMS